MSRSIYRHIYLERIVSTQETNKRLLLPAYIINTCFLTQTTSNYHNNRFKLHTFPSNNRRPLNFPFHHIQIHARDEHIQSSALYTPRKIATLQIINPHPNVWRPISFPANEMKSSISTSRSLKARLSGLDSDGCSCFSIHFISEKSLCYSSGTSERRDGIFRRLF